MTRRKHEGPSWSGRFTFGRLWAAYIGPAGESTPHAHVAVQVVMAAESGGQVTVVADRKRVGRAFIICPLVPHALEARGRIWSIYLEASSPLAQLLRRGAGHRQVVAVPRRLTRLLVHGDTPEAWLQKVETDAGLSPPSLDPRLHQAVGELLRAPGSVRIDEAARRARVSTARLRALARQQLGVPLATWLLWQKLDRAGRAIASGARFAEAAQAGGFADQPHFARTMHRMFGLTPREAARALR